MQSLRLLHELSAFSNNEARSPRAIRECFVEGEEEAYPIQVKIFPSTSANLEQEKGKENYCEKEEGQNENEGMELEGGEEEGEREYSEAELARFRRRMLFPTETINEVCMFLPFVDCNRQYTTCSLLHALLEPRRKICMEVFIKRLDDAREKLNQTIQDVEERRRHVNQLSDHIGAINVRLEEMGNHLAELDVQILDNHSKLNELHARIERMRTPVEKLENKSKMNENE